MAHHAVAAAPHTIAARSRPHAEPFQQHREPVLEDLRIGQPAVGHVRLHRAGPVRRGARARPAGDRLVILMAVVAEREIVHRALRSRQHAQRAVQRIRHHLARLDIAGHHRRGKARRQHRSLRQHDRHAPQAAVVHRDRPAHQRAEHIHDGGPRDRSRRVEIGRLLIAGPGEIHGRGPRRAVDPHRDAHHRAAIHRIGEPALGQIGDQRLHRRIRIGLHMLHIGRHGGQAVRRHQRVQPGAAARAGGDLRPQVGDVAIRIARRPRPARQQRPHRGFAEAPLVHHQHVVEQHAFLQHAGAARRHRSGARSADIGMMPARRDEEIGHRAAAVGKHRQDDGQVGQMRAPRIGRVQRIDVAAPDPAPVGRAAAIGQDRADAVAHRSQMHRNMRRVGDQIAGGVEQRARKIQPLADVHR